MSDPNFGVVFNLDDNEARPAITADLSTIGIVGPCDSADPTTFPLDTPVAFYSNDSVMGGLLGDSDFIGDAVRGINDQLGTLQRAAQIIFVRTAKGASADPAIKQQQTIANIMGQSNLLTGMWALTRAGTLCGAIPRIILTPGYTGMLATGVDHLTQTAPGVGYAPVGDVRTLTFSGGGANAVQATGHAVVQANGSLGGIVIDSPGAWYTSAPAVAVGGAAPSGTGAAPAAFTAVTANLANPICAGLEGLLEQLLGHAIVETPGTSQTGDLAFRSTLDAKRLILVMGGCKVVDPTSGSIVTMPFAPRVAGLLVRRDHEVGNPFSSAANQPVQGIVGPSRVLGFSITDGANEGQALIGANIGILVTGEVGNDFSIASGGYVFIGTDNVGDDELWRFYNQVRGRDFLHLTLLRNLRYYLGKFNITPQTVQATVNSMKNVCRDLQADEAILGYKVNFNGSQNSADAIRVGKIAISFAAEEPSPLKLIVTRSQRYREAVDAMVSSLEAQLNLAA